MIKKTALAATFLVFSAPSMADELNSFKSIQQAATHGKRIHIAVEFSKCTSSQPIEEAKGTAVYTPNEIHVTDSSIAMAFSHFTLNDGKFPGRPVNEFISYKIESDNILKLHIKTLDAISYDVINDEYSFDCKLGQGAKIYS